MENKFTFALLLTASIFKSSFAVQYKIVGNFQHINNQWIYLRYLNDSLEKQIDSAYATNGRFIFKGEIAEPTRGDIYTTDEKIDDDFFFETGNTFLSGDTMAPHSIIAMGGKSTAEYNDYKTGETPRENLRDSMSEQISTLAKRGDTTAARQLWKEFQIVYTKHKQEEETWMVQHNTSMVNAFFLYAFYDQPENIAKGDSLLALMAPNVQQSKYIRKREKIKHQLVLRETGKPVIPFAQTDTSGKEISTKTFAGKYFLIDFWASWCRPCRGENPNLVKAYRKFHPKGFEIISVSLDDKKEHWVKAIAQDSLEWNHVSDLKGWENAVAQLYSIRSIPDNFLIDKSGKIIATSLRGEALDAKLEEIYGK